MEKIGSTYAAPRGQMRDIGEPSVAAQQTVMSRLDGIRKCLDGIKTTLGNTLTTLEGSAQGGEPTKQPSMNTMDTLLQEIALLAKAIDADATRIREKIGE